LTPRVRAVVAYVASRLISGAESSFIFDFAGPGHRSMGGTINEKCVNVYDYSENCQLTGNFSAGLFHLFHQGEQVHISLEITGHSFRGRDLSTGRQFSGTVAGPKTSIYDQVDHRRYSYWCEHPGIPCFPTARPEMSKVGWIPRPGRLGLRIQLPGRAYSSSSSTGRLALARILSATNCGTMS